MNAPEPAVAWLWTARILGIGLLIQTVELFLGRRIYSRTGALVGGGSVVWGLVVRGGLSLWLIFGSNTFGPVVTTVTLAALLLSSGWLSHRSRGPVGGGSDSMFFQVQLGLFLATLGFVHPLLPRLGLGWIAAQSVLSYFLAGVGKIRNSNWRDGLALQHLFASQGPYVLLRGVRPLAATKWLCVLLGWGVVLFELAFPAILILPEAGKLVLLGVALAFHLTNAVVLGLNRFIWAWAATYPALLYFL